MVGVKGGSKREEKGKLERGGEGDEKGGETGGRSEREEKEELGRGRRRGLTLEETGGRRGRRWEEKGRRSEETKERRKGS